jgi:hypothetical protein
VTTAFAPANQTADFVTCQKNRYENSYGTVACGGRVNTDDNKCEYGHTYCTAGIEEAGYCDCFHCVAYEDHMAFIEREAEIGYERSLEINMEQADETMREAAYEAYILGW